jgi:hypothetical protein
LFGEREHLKRLVNESEVRKKDDDEEDREDDREQFS